MLAVLAGFAVAALGRRLTHPGRWRAAAVALVLIVNVEALRAPLGYREYQGIPRIYDDLATVKNAVVAEIPLWPPKRTWPMAPYMLNSTRHWHPILEGYSGFEPRSYASTYDALKGFPDDASLVGMHQRGVTHVVVHRSSMDPAQFALIKNIASLRWQNDDGEIFIYTLR
jgi:hypothetical protein